MKNPAASANRIVLSSINLKTLARMGFAEIQPEVTLFERSYGDCSGDKGVAVYFTVDQQKEVVNKAADFLLTVKDSVLRRNLNLLIHKMPYGK